MATGKYGKWVDVGPSARQWVADEVKVRVICIPQAGMGAWAFHGFQEKLGREASYMEILPIELPGRNSRMAEAKPTTMGATVEAMVEGLSSSGVFDDDKPYFLVGHSLGAWMAYEVACAATASRNIPSPSLLVVSGARSAALASVENDAAPSLSALPTTELFWEHFERRYGRNPDLQSAMVRAYVEPLLRADFGLLETYEPSTSRRLPVPIVACGAKGDSRFTLEQLEAWSELTSQHFETRLFDVTPLDWSTPHRYVVEDPQPLVDLLKELGAAQLNRQSTSLSSSSSNTETAAAVRLPGAYVVSSKNGALVRAGLELESAQLDILAKGTACVVAEIVAAPPSGGNIKKPRARLEAPLAGWVSLHVLNPAP